jgi:hypothetical protein
MSSVVTVLVRILEGLFLLGILGSAVVLILTIIEDSKSLLPGKTNADERATPARSSTMGPATLTPKGSI